MAGITKCLVMHDMNRSKCDTKTIGREVRNSMLLGFAVDRAKNLHEIKNLPTSKQQLEAALKKVSKDPDYLAIKDKFSVKSVKPAIVKTKEKFQPLLPAKFRRPL